MNGLMMLDCFLWQNAGLYTIWVVPSLNTTRVSSNVSSNRSSYTNQSRASDYSRHSSILPSRVEETRNGYTTKTIRPGRSYLGPGEPFPSESYGDSMSGQGKFVMDVAWYKAKRGGK